MSRLSAGATRRMAIMTLGVLVSAALFAAACGGTSSADKTKTAAAASGGKTTVATSAATSAATKAATAASTGTVASGTPAATGATTVKIAAAGSLGNILTDATGMTLYTFKNDVANSGKSAAEGLTAAWPPLTLDSGTPVKPDGLSGDLAVITRVDGKKQVTYKGLPLYFYFQDKAAGDTKGQGVGGVWFVAQP